MSEGQWYYCLTHHVVEPYGACKAIERLGPYDTPAEAAKALEKAEERNREWEEDPRFNEPADEEPDEWDRESEGWGPFRH